MFRARNIVVYWENLIHSAEKCLCEKVSNKDVQMCLNELQSGFSWVVCLTYVAKIGDERNTFYLCSYSRSQSGHKKLRYPQTLLPIRCLMHSVLEEEMGFQADISGSQKNMFVLSWSTSFEQNSLQIHTRLHLYSLPWLGSSSALLLKVGIW